MMIARLIPHILEFITPGKTSRGTLTHKPSWYILLKKENSEGLGECPVIPGLSPEYDGSYIQKVQDVINQINQQHKLPDPESLNHLPSLRFGLETAWYNLQHSQNGILFPSDFTDGKEGIPINGLVWMGSAREMKQRAIQKIEQGFRVLKFKVGALDFEQELSLLKAIRQEFSTTDLEIRLDANGAFDKKEAGEKLQKLAAFHIHSVEQPLKPGQWEAMADLCEKSPIPIALDEELIGIHQTTDKEKLLTAIRPQYIILKPSLTGGLVQSREWIDIARKHQVDWWVTSALESNVGLNAIAQWTFTLQSNKVQGLGTGQVFRNNMQSPLELRGPVLFYNPEKKWGNIPTAS